MQNVVYDDSSLDACCANTDIQKVVVAKGVKVIAAMAFLNCSSLESVVIPSTVVTIAKQAFQGCSSLQKVIFPANLRAIQSEAFYGCKSLKEISIPASVKRVGNSAFALCVSLETVFFSGARNVAATLGTRAFHNCVSLASVIVGEGLFHNSRLTSQVDVGELAFEGCSALRFCAIPVGVNVRPQAFKTTKFENSLGLFRALQDENARTTGLGPKDIEDLKRRAMDTDTELHRVNCTLKEEIQDLKLGQAELAEEHALEVQSIVSSHQVTLKDSTQRKDELEQRVESLELALVRVKDEARNARDSLDACWNEKLRALSALNEELLKREVIDVDRGSTESFHLHPKAALVLKQMREKSSSSAMTALAAAGGRMQIKQEALDQTVAGKQKAEAELDDATHCVVCMESLRRVLFLPCSHLAVCEACSSDLTECPVARCCIDKRITAFLS